MTQHAGQLLFGNVKLGRHADHEHAARHPADDGTCGVPNAGAGPTSTLALQLICANQLLGPVRAGAGMVYPRTTRIVMPPLPRGLRTMPDPCRGVPANAFCARSPRFTG